MTLWLVGCLAAGYDPWWACPNTSPKCWGPTPSVFPPLLPSLSFSWYCLIPRSNPVLIYSQHQFRLPCCPGMCLVSSLKCVFTVSWWNVVDVLLFCGAVLQRVIRENWLIRYGIQETAPRRPPPAANVINQSYEVSSLLGYEIYPLFALRSCFPWTALNQWVRQG